VAKGGDITHPLLEKHEGDRRIVIIISTDKGLCGGLNTNLMREAAKMGPETKFITAGRKGSQFIARTRRPLVAEFTYKDAPQFSEARAISKMAREMYLNGEVDRVDILYTHFISTLNQKPELRQLLPMGEIKPITVGIGAAHQQEPAPATAADGGGEFLFEPGQDEAVNFIARPFPVLDLWHGHYWSGRNEGPMRLIFRALGNPGAQHIFFFFGQGKIGGGRRHPFVQVIGKDALHDQTFFRLAGDDGMFGRVFARPEGLGGQVEPQSSLPARFVRPMTFETPVRDNGADIAVILQRPKGFSRGNALAPTERERHH